jgi:large repetitive protein
MYTLKQGIREHGKILLLFLLVSSVSFAQQPSGNCDPITPFFVCNLSGNPGGTWVSAPPVQRDGNCCGTTAPDKCIEFEITLDSQAVGINFTIASGAMPPGALFYQVNCGPPVSVGTPLCLSGPGPYTLTFCKPGNNMNTYAIASYGPPGVSPGDTIGSGCSATMHATGVLENSSLTWNSVYPGAYGSYNSYLGCTQGCDTTTVTNPSTGAPPYVDYVVCGTPLLASCLPNPLFCDTIRIYFTPPITATVNPNPAVYCASDTGILLSGAAGGGVPPFTYAWTSGANGSGTVVGTGTSYMATSPGNYSFIVYDQNYPACPPLVTNVVVSTTPVPSVTVGPDHVACAPTVQLSATVSAASGGVWSGGQGTFSPGSTSPNAVYTPSQAELSAGTFTLTFTSTGNGACAAAADQLVITLIPPMTVTLSAPPVLCFGDTTTITATASGGLVPYTYTWTGGQQSPVISATGGTYSVNVTGNAAGCIASGSIIVNTPPPLAISQTVTGTNCGGTNGSAIVNASGGTPNYSYTWLPGPAYGPAINNQPPGSYTLTVADANNCQENYVITINVAAVPVNANFSASSACLNNATAFTDLSFSADTISSWQWDFGEPISGISNFSSQQNPGHMYGSPGTYTVTLIVSTNKGCSDTIALSVVVHPLPVVNFSWMSACGGQSVFTSSISISSGSVSNLAWNFGDLSSGSSNISLFSNPTHTYGATGTYQVLLTATSNNGCQASLQQAVLVPAVPVAQFGYKNNCKDVPAQFTDSSTIVNGTITSWSWNFGDGSSLSNLQNPVHTYTSNAIYTVSLIVTSGTGCSDTLSLPVDLQQVLTPGFSAPFVCFNKPTQFSDYSSVNFGSVTSWSWNFGDFSVPSNAANPTHLYGTPGTFLVTLSVTSSNGCIASGVLPVQVYAVPVADFTSKNSCANSGTAFTDQSTISSDYIAGWLWAFGDGSPVSNLQHPQHVYQSPGAYNVTLVVSSNKGCVDTTVFPLQVHILPVVALSMADSGGCANFCTGFADLSSSSDGMIVNWAWNFGDGTATGLAQHPGHCYTSGGLYSISLAVTTSYGCTDSVTLKDAITVYHTPHAAFTYSPGVITGVEQEVSFADQSDTSAWAWHWDFDDPHDPLHSLQQHPKHAYADTGSYCISLIVENRNHCTDTVVHCLRVEPDFTFFIPNAFTPGSSAGKNDHFGGEGTYIRDYEMWIFDRWGNMIFHSENLAEKWDGRPNGSDKIAQEDVYVYKVELHDVFGELHQYSGTISLVR